jgi:hypothetical protein
MIEDDRNYFLRRAEAERRRAAIAHDPRAVQAHHRLSEAYLAKLSAGGAGRERTV